MRATGFTEGFAPPDEHHNSDAQIKSGETRHSLKIPTVSDKSLPRALLCSHLDVCSQPFRSFYFGGANSQLPCAGTARFRWFAPSWMICTNSPFHPTVAPAG
ncbi:hypothetical protein SK39_05097 [Citrobacter sp. BIDMC107]|nr:hypothetical protein SK39_05097 [Citrobacter sp. BIDMC107]OUE62695.1 hypothetical protein AZ007_004975 [Citrobacter freundii]